MGGYSGPTAGQAYQIQQTYQQTGDYPGAVQTALGGYPTYSVNPLSSTIFDTDPTVQLAKEQEQLGLSNIKTQLQTLIDRIVANYGDPAIASMAGFGLDPQAAAFAQQNYLAGNAELARLDQGHKQNLQKIINQLAGHGLVFSGETGYQTGLEDKAYGNNVYDAQSNALQQILAAMNTAEQQRQQVESNLQNAYENAYNVYASNPELYGAYTQVVPQTVVPNIPSTSANAVTAPPPAVSKPKASTAPSKPKATKTVAKQLVNPYTTGQKLRG